MSFAKVIATLLLICTISISGSCQDYVVLNSGDTLFGKVKGRKSKVYSKVVLRLPSGKTKRFRPNEIESFRVDNGGSEERFLSRLISDPVWSEPEHAFLKIEIDGKLKLLYYHFYSVVSGPANHAAGAPIGGSRKDSIPFLLLTDSLHYPWDKEFQDSTSRYLKANENLSSSIRKGELTPEDLLLIVKLFNGQFDSRATHDGFERGYVELETGAKLMGQLKRLSARQSSKGVVFIDQSGNPLQVLPNIIKGYKRGKSIYLKKGIPCGENDMKFCKAFLKVLAKGKISLYKHYGPFIDKNDDEAYGSIDGTGFSRGESIYIERDGILSEVKKSKFRKEMSVFFSDHPKLSEQIEDRIAKFEHLPEMVNEYNRYLSSLDED